MKNKKKIIGIILLECIGVVFLLSAIGKINDVGSFGELIIKYGLPHFSILSPIIVFLEVFCGVLLISCAYPRFSTTLTISLLILFTLIFSYAHIFNDIEDCGCFGSFGIGAPAWVTYLRNAVLLAALIGARILLSGEKRSFAKEDIVITASILCVFCFFIGKSYRLPSYYTPYFGEIHPLFHKEVIDTPIADCINISKDSTYILYVFSYDCQSCINGLNNIMQYDREKIADHFYGLAVTEDKDGLIHKEFSINFDEIQIGEKLKGFVENIPAIIYIKDGEIHDIIEGDVPALYNFRRNYLSDNPF